MQRDEVIERIREAMPELQQRYGVVSLSVFGSTARGSASEESDVDVLADGDQPPTFEAFLGLRDSLKQLLEADVDLLDRAGLQPHWRRAIEQEALLVA